MQPRSVVNELVRALIIPTKSWKMGLKEKKISTSLYMKPLFPAFFFPSRAFLKKNVTIRVPMLDACRCGLNSGTNGGQSVSAEEEHDLNTNQTSFTAGFIRGP